MGEDMDDEDESDEDDEDERGGYDCSAKAEETRSWYTCKSGRREGARSIEGDRYRGRVS